MPRLTKRTKAVEDQILSRLRAGEPLAKICRDDDLPCAETWRNWCDADETLAIAYARAREIGFDVIAADALEIMDSEPQRVVTVSGEDRSESRFDSAAVQWAFRRVELRLKLLAKWDPKRYGDMMKHAGHDAGPLALTVTSEDAAL